jgi:hypothetical protein
VETSRTTKCSTDPRGAARRARLRGRARGTGLLEGRFVAIVLIALFVGLVGTAGLYKAKLIAMQDARYQAMWNATNNCSPDGRAYYQQWSTLPEAQGPPVESAPITGVIDAVRIIDDGGGVSRATSKGSFHFMGISGTVSSYSFSTCNEQAAGANAFAVLGTYFQKAWGVFAQDVVNQIVSAF